VDITNYLALVKAQAGKKQLSKTQGSSASD
jgi:hypothetical protein